MITFIRNAGLTAAWSMALVLTMRLALGPSVAAQGTSVAAQGQPLESMHELTQVDADAWLDGYLGEVLTDHDIAGAVVVIVKDGVVLTQRGFGYADVASRRRVDPASTLFRPGSISKLFTWTAVMQLAEAGKIDLDADVNRYLDFKIPPFEGRPITLRNAMTHRSGFEEAFKGGFRFNGPVPPLSEVLKQMLPQRVFAAGTTPAYSNYAAGLAGYVVERVSGEPFEDYIEKNIFQPLGMTHSTFRQPLPPELARLMATGYPQASVEPKPFEIISVPPAGSASISGADMARFMIAQLNQGTGLMRPDTAELMHTPAYGVIPGTNRMALGFYEQQCNGRSAIAHGGDLNYFSSYLWLLPSEHVGLYLSMNSAGTGGENFGVRLQLFEQFCDRYFPASNDAPVDLTTAKEHAQLLTGSYVSSRGEFSTFLDASNLLGQTRIRLDQDGRPLIPPMFGGVQRHWTEIAPFVWQDTYGHQRLGATLENGRVTRWSIDALSPFMIWNRVPWYRDATWLIPVSVSALVIIALMALSWPIGAVNRRRSHVGSRFVGPDLAAFRLSRIASWLVLTIAGGWGALLASIDSDTVLSWQPWLAEIAGTICILGLVGATVWNCWRSVQRYASWFAIVWNALLVSSAVFLAWIMLEFHLISFGARY